MKQAKTLTAAELRRVTDSIATRAHAARNRAKKNYCLATETKQKSFCYTIANADLKNMCMAQLKQEKYYCYKILSDEVQKECLKLVK